MKSILIGLLLPLTVLANTNNDTQPADRDDATINIPIPAGAVVVMRHQLGIGTPGLKGLEPAVHMGEGIYHAPQYMAAYPTAGVIWARVVDVECTKAPTGEFVCDGYDWAPALGRGEYLFIRPTMKPEKCPCGPTMVTVPGPERIILKEVPVKRKPE